MSNKSQLLSETDNQFFNQKWQIYQKVLQGNYMEHRQLYNVVHQFLLTYFSAPFKLLELGCGDATFTAQALLDTKVSAYTGIDLSPEALAIAQEKMRSIPIKQTFLQGNLVELVPQLLAQQKQNFELIFSSYVLHHLNLKDKELIMEQIYHLLSDNGIFLLIDTVLPPQENRETFLSRYLNNVRQNWSTINPQEYLAIEEHMTSSDFPETQATLYSFAQQHGFDRCECLAQDSLNTAQLLCFYK